MPTQAQLRTAGGLAYTLERKRVKNLNLRVKPDGSVWASAPRRASVASVDAFVASRADWVRRQQASLRAVAAAEAAEPLPSREAALALFEEVSAKFFPLFAARLGGRPPEIKVRQMSSRWGVCCPAKRRITLALRLAAKPRPLIEYVVLHEYCHFVHPDHQAGFWGLVESIMPDAKVRRRALRGG